MPIRILIDDMGQCSPTPPQPREFVGDMNFDVPFDSRRTWRQALQQYFAAHDGLRIVPILGQIREQLTAVAPTPHHYGRASGDLLMAFQMSDSQQTTITAAFTDKRNNPAAVPAGGVTWAVDNTQLLAIAPSADGLSAVVSAVGPLGSGTVSMKVADPTGAVLASGSLDVTVVGGAPVNVVLTPGAATEEPAPAPAPAPAPVAPATPAA